MSLLQMILAANLIRVDGEWLDCPVQLKTLAQQMLTAMAQGASRDDALTQLHNERFHLVIQGRNVALTFHNLVNGKALGGDDTGSVMVFNNDGHGRASYVMVAFYCMTKLTGDSPILKGGEGAEPPSVGGSVVAVI